MSITSDPALKFLCAVAVHAEIEELLPRFSRAYDIDVDVLYDVNPAVARRAQDGEAFDVGLTNPWYVDELIAGGRAAPGIHIPFGRVPLTIGAAGADPVDITSSLEGIRDLLLGARSIAYTSIGTSGKTFLRALDGMGLRDGLAGRLHPMGAGEPPAAAARGEVQYAIAPMSRILAAPGVVPVATFPPELGLHIDMSMFVRNGSRHPAAMPLMQFLSAPEQSAYLRSHGVDRFELQPRSG